MKTDKFFKDFIKLPVSVSALSLSGNLFHKIGAAGLMQTHDPHMYK